MVAFGICVIAPAVTATLSISAEHELLSINTDQVPVATPGTLNWAVGQYPDSVAEEEAESPSVTDTMAPFAGVPEITVCTVLLLLGGYDTGIQS